MSASIEYVKIVVVTPAGKKYQVEINSALTEKELIDELTGSIDELSQQNSYSIRGGLQREGTKIKNDAIIVLDLDKMRNVREVQLIN